MHCGFSIEHRVRFVVIGGFAADLLGAPLNTDDLDVCYDTSPENTLRLAAALQRARGKAPNRPGRHRDALRPRRPDPRRRGTVDLRHARRVDSTSLRPRGTAGFPDLAAKAISVSMGDFDVPIVALADLMRMKRAGVRIEDKMQLEVLAALQEMIEEVEQDTPA